MAGGVATIAADDRRVLTPVVMVQAAVVALAAIDSAVLSVTISGVFLLANTILTVMLQRERRRRRRDRGGRHRRR